MKRIHILNAIGWVCLLGAVICGIGVIGSVGAMEWGAPIVRCTVQGLVLMAAACGFGKIGTALVLM
jgi:hypothetical protein